MQHRKKALLKITMVGDSSVGKTSLMNQYVNSKFSQKKPKSSATGADFLTKELMTEDRQVTVQIWDTPGNQKLQALGPVFYQGTDCCLLMFDITNRASFEALDTWREEFFAAINSLGCVEQFPLVVIGNKIDLGAERAVSVQEAREYCMKRGIVKADKPLYWETSAKSSEHIQEMFLHVTQLALQGQPDGDDYMIAPPSPRLSVGPLPVANKMQSVDIRQKERPPGVKAVDNKCRMCASCGIQ